MPRVFVAQSVCEIGDTGVVSLLRVGGPPNHSLPDSNSLVMLGGVHPHLNGRQLVPCSIGATATSITRRAVVVSTRLPHSRPEILDEKNS